MFMIAACKSFSKYYCVVSIIHFSQHFHKEYVGSVALLLHFTSSEVRFLDLVFLHCAGGPGNPCYMVQVRNCKCRTSLQVKYEF